MCGPEVELAQEVEELLFRAYTLSRQVHLTFESGRDRALCLQMTYGVVAGIFKELDLSAVTGRELHAHEVPRERVQARRGVLHACVRSAWAGCATWAACWAG